MIMETKIHCEPTDGGMWINNSSEAVSDLTPVWILKQEDDLYGDIGGTETYQDDVKQELGDEENEDGYMEDQVG
jgi:hypothetical protein